jgi:hypothetical protein
VRREPTGKFLVDLAIEIVQQRFQDTARVWKYVTRLQQRLNLLTLVTETF